MMLLVVVVVVVFVVVEMVWNRIRKTSPKQRISNWSGGGLQVVVMVVVFIHVY